MLSPFHKNGKGIVLPSDIKVGDILGFSGDAWGSAAINVVTYGIPWWSLSHCGIVGEHNGRLLLFESCTNNILPCEVLGSVIQGSQAQDIRRKIADYAGKVYHYPLYRTLFAHERQRLQDFLLETTGHPYDRIGAFRAGGVGFSWMESKLRCADLSSLFCSEWCASAHAEIGIFPNDNGARWNPNYFVRKERRLGLLKKPRRLK